MDLHLIAKQQAEFDREHGWSTDTPEPEPLVAGLQKDVVGIVGEIGEFANILQKIERTRTDGELPYPDFESQRGALGEELADVFIYLLRLANRLGVDLESEYHAKTSKNTERFRRFRKP